MKNFSAGRKHARSTGPTRKALPRLEVLEDRAVPTTVPVAEFALPLSSYEPSAIIRGPDRLLWFIQDQQVGSMDSRGAVQDVYQVSDSTYGVRLIAMAADVQGNIWYTEASKVGFVNPRSRKFKEYSVPSAYGICAGPDGYLYFTEPGSNAIGWINTNGDYHDLVIPTGKANPHGICIGPDGAFYFTESNTFQIGRMDRAGHFLEIPVTSRSYPEQIVPGPDGNLWFTEPNTDQIGAMDLGHHVREWRLSAGSQPKGIAVGADRALWFAEAGTDKVGRITTGGTIAEFSGLTHSSYPVGVTAGYDGNIWVTEHGGNRVGRLAVSPGTVTVTGADAGGGPDVHVYDAASYNPKSPQLPLVYQMYAYDVLFTGGVRVAVGDVSGDGIPDLVTAPGPGGGPDVRVFDIQNPGHIVREFMAYSPAFTGGVNVAVADLNGDGFADIVTAADAGGGPHVEVFSGKDGSILRSFMAYDPAFTGGVRVAVGDVNGDGGPDLITGAGPGGGPHVQVFDGVSGTVLRSFMAYPVGFSGGVYVAAGDTDGDGMSDVITGAGAGGGPNVRVFRGADGRLLQDFMAYGVGFTGGVRVGVADLNPGGLADILTGAGPGGGPDVRTFDGRSLGLLDAFFAYDTRFGGGVFVGSV